MAVYDSATGTFEAFSDMDRQMRAFEMAMQGEADSVIAHAKQGELKASADLNAEARREHALELAIRIRRSHEDVGTLVADAAAIEAFLRDGKQSST